jgi:hypothetical protein
VQFDCGTRILRVIHGRDAGTTFSNCTSAPGVRYCVGQRLVIESALSVSKGCLSHVFVLAVRGVRLREQRAVFKHEVSDSSREKTFLDHALRTRAPRDGAVPGLMMFRKPDELAGPSLQNLNFLWSKGQHLDNFCCHNGTHNNQKEK